MKPLWEHQKRAIPTVIGRLNAGTRQVLLVSPTGSGKTRILLEIVKHYLENGKKVEFITNRKLLAQQTMGVFTNAGVRFGRRMAGHEQDITKNFHISMMQTLNHKVYKQERWDHFKADLVLIDEAHVQKGSTVMKMIKDRHTQHGTQFLGATATPQGLGVAGWTEQVKAAGIHELFRGEMLLPSRTFAPSEPDMRSIKNRVSTSFTDTEVDTMMRLPMIAGDIVQEYWKLNPNQLPTVAYGPSVSSSRWLCEYLNDNMIAAAHIDGKKIYYGNRDSAGNPQDIDADDESREELIERVATGDVKVVCNRFVLREGIDIPELYMGILATVFSGINPYIQVCGRLMRANGRDDHCVVMDCGGNYWRHGSPNEERCWKLDESEADYERGRRKETKEGKKSEPTVCAKCHKVLHDFEFGMLCPFCGTPQARRYRRIWQDGKPLILANRMSGLPKTKPKSDQQIWDSCFFQAKNSGWMTFNQARKIFKERTGRMLPMNLRKLPKRKIQWNQRVCDARWSELT